MTRLIALLVLALIIGVASLAMRGYLKAVLVGAVAAMTASAIASVVYVAIDYRELSLWPILFAPIFEGAVVGALAAAAFKIAHSRIHAATFVTLVAICGCALGFLVGEVFVGHPPQFSHDKVIVVLSLSWCVIALGVAWIYVLSSNKSLELSCEPKASV